MSSKLLDLVDTRENQKLLLEELLAAEESLYKKGPGNWEETLKSKLRMEVAGIISAEISDAGIDKKHYLREMIDRVRKMKTVKIIIAVTPTQQLINNITEWIRSAVGAGIILELEIDRNIMGGAKISCNGKYWDGSLIRIWEETWENKRKELECLINI